MSEIEFQCPGCARRFSVPATQAGKKAGCRHCNIFFLIPSSAPAPAAEPAEPARPPEPLPAAPEIRREPEPEPEPLYIPDRGPGPSAARPPGRTPPRTLAFREPPPPPPPAPPLRQQSVGWTVTGWLIVAGVIVGIKALTAFAPSKPPQNRPPIRVPRVPEFKAPDFQKDVERSQIRLLEEVDRRRREAGLPPIHGVHRRPNGVGFPTLPAPVAPPVAPMPDEPAPIPPPRTGE